MILVFKKYSILTFEIVNCKFQGKIMLTKFRIVDSKV